LADSFLMHSDINTHLLFCFIWNQQVYS
jgi:hypothetical protein